MITNVGSSRNMTSTAYTLRGVDATRQLLLKFIWHTVTSESNTVVWDDRWCKRENDDWGDQLDKEMDIKNKIRVTEDENDDMVVRLTDGQLKMLKQNWAWWRNRRKDIVRWIYDLINNDTNYDGWDFRVMDLWKGKKKKISRVTLFLSSVISTVPPGLDFELQDSGVHWKENAQDCVFM